MKKITPYIILLMLATSLTVQSSTSTKRARLSLQQAILYAWETDPWLQGSLAQEKATMARSLASGTLPDPKLLFGLANFPIDTFNHHQEPMTQAQVGLTQVFPRGKSRTLKKQQFAQMSRQYPHLRNDRRLKLAVNIAQVWLDAVRNQEKIRLIEQDRRLFDHLVDVAESSYASARGGAGQQDVIRAQLESMRLEARVQKIRQDYETARVALEQWLQEHDGSLADNWQLVAGLPSIPAPQDFWLTQTDQSLLRTLLIAHPIITSVDQRIQAGKTGIVLAKQAYKAQWGVSLGYAHREDDMLGEDRANFLSLGVSVELPVFGHTKQDKTLEAAVENTEVLRAERALLLRKLHAKFESLLVKLRQLNQREALYTTRLIGKTHEQAEAAFNAYISGKGSFSDVVRARIAELNTKIHVWDINVDRHKVLAEFIYFFPEHSPELWSVSNGEIK